MHSRSSSRLPTACFKPIKAQASLSHQFIISGTSIPTPGSDLLVSENVSLPPTAPNTNEGCDSPEGSTVSLIDPSGNESASLFPCFDHPTIWICSTPKRNVELLQLGARLSVTGPDTIKHIRYGAHWENVIDSRDHYL